MAYSLAFVLNLYLVAVSNIFWWIFIFHQPCVFWFHGFHFGSKLKLLQPEWLWVSQHFWPFQEAYSIRLQVYFYHIKYICSSLCQHLHKLGSWLAYIKHMIVSVTMMPYYIEWRNSNDPGIQWKPPKSQLYEGQGLMNQCNSKYVVRFCLDCLESFQLKPHTGNRCMDVDV